MHPALEADLVGIEVAHSGQDRLVEKGTGLSRVERFSIRAEKISFNDLESIGAQLDLLQVGRQVFDVKNPPNLRGSLNPMVNPSDNFQANRSCRGLSSSS